MAIINKKEKNMAVPVFNSYDEIPSSFSNHIMSVADADRISDIPLHAINEYMHNMPVDKFFNILGEKFALDDFMADNNINNQRY